MAIRYKKVAVPDTPADKKRREESRKAEAKKKKKDKK